MPSNGGEILSDKAAEQFGIWLEKYKRGHGIDHDSVPEYVAESAWNAVIEWQRSEIEPQSQTGTDEGLTEQIREAQRNFPVTREEIVRIRNTTVGKEYVQIWSRMLHHLCDAAESLRSLSPQASQEAQSAAGAVAVAYISQRALDRLKNPPTEVTACEVFAKPVMYADIPLFARPAPPASEGMVMVPREPTDEMVAAGALITLRDPSTQDFEQARRAAKIVLMRSPEAGTPQAAHITSEGIAAMIATMIPYYREMIAAAPQPPAADMTKEGT